MSKIIRKCQGDFLQQGRCRIQTAIPNVPELFKPSLVAQTATVG